MKTYGRKNNKCEIMYKNDRCNKKTYENDFEKLF